MKKQTIMYWSLVIIAAVTLIYIWFLTKPVETAIIDDGSALKFNVENLTNEDGVINCKLFIPNMENRNYLGFYTIHQEVEIYVGGKLIYEFRNMENSIAKSPGYKYNFVRLEDEYYGKAIRIVIRDVYNNSNTKVPDFYYGSYYGLKAKVLRDDIAEFVICIIIFLFGAIMQVYYLLAKKVADIGKKLLYLGLFSTLLSIWSINETELFVMLANNSIFCMYLAFIMLMLLPIPFALFIKEAYNQPDDKIWKSMFIVSYLQILVSTVLQWTGIADYRETVILTHLSIVYIFIVIFIKSIKEIAKGNKSRTYRLNLVCMIIVIVSASIDIAVYYGGTRDSNVFGRMGFLIYIIALGFDSIGNSITLIEMGKKTSMYRKLAYIDTLTNMKNRTAYDHMVEKNKGSMADNSNLAVVMFDLNDLKKCNDYYGHETGDRYIKKAGDIIKEVFEKAGVPYRIGGDEFCVVIKDSSKVDIDSLLDKLDNYVNKCKIEENCDYMSIAHGYVIFDRNFDKDIEDVRDRADKLMYANKDKIKRSRAD